ncbi:hypothetical protein [Streptomyces kronopolitis]
MPKQISAARRTSMAGLLTAAALALGGCATYDVTAPADARADAPAAAVKAMDARLAAARRRRTGRAQAGRPAGRAATRSTAARPSASR